MSGALRREGGTLNFSGRELRDLFVAWLALSLAFAVFFAGGGARLLLFGPGRLVELLVRSLLTAGVAFLLHEVAHKVVAVRFGQIAEFRADYGMLFIAVVSALAGFLFAAPGAVHHRGRLTEREHGLIALAGPVTNLILAVAFVPVWLVAPTIGGTGVAINLLLAGFNMLPFGPLDGRTVLSWSKIVFVLVFVPSAGLALLVFLGGGLL